jgi:peptidoglycan-associated lipoprotein
MVLVMACALLLATGCAKKPAPEQETARPPAQEGMKTDQVIPAPDRVEAAPAPVSLAGRESEVDDFENEYIYFDFNRYTLTPEATAVLNRKVAFLKAHADLAVEVQGHCDERGTAEYNMALGDRRAKAARDYLFTMGIGASRLTSISYGEERPIDTAGSEEAWAKNRRAQFVISNK